MKLNQQVLSKILSSSTENIALFVATNRLLNSNKEETKQCMIELMKRKAQGDEFDFVSYIEKTTQDNKFNLNLKPFASVKQQISSVFTSALMEVQANPETTDDGEDEEDDIDEDLFK